MAALDVFLVLAFVLAAVAPSVHTRAVHLVVDPLAIVLAVVRPLVHAFAMEVVVQELALIAGAIRPSELAMTYSTMSPIPINACFIFAKCMQLDKSCSKPDFIVPSPPLLSQSHASE